MRRPKLIQVLALRVGEFGAHLQPIRLHKVQRTQHAIQTAQDANVVLQPLQIVHLQAARSQPLIDIAIEGQYRLP